MNQEQKLQKLFEILETVDKGFATSDEVAEICSEIINSVKQLKTVTEEQYKAITSKIGVILSNHNVLSRDLDHSSDILSKEITALKKVVTNLKLQHGKDGKDGKDADIDLVAEKASKLAQNDLKKILPKELKLEDVLKDLPAYGEKVRDALELLQGEERLDASAIKGLQEIIKGLKQEKATIIGANKPLSGLLDVDVAGIAVNQSIRWDGIKWVAYTPSAGGESAFKDLTDTPNSYTSQAGKGVRVKGTEDGLEFYTTDDSDEKVKLNASDPTAGYLDDKITGYGFVTGTPWTSEGYITNISGQDLSTADNSTSQFITAGDIPTETDPAFSAWLLNTPPLYPGGWYDAVQNTIGLSGFDNDLGIVSFPGFTDLSTDYGFTDNSTDWDTAYGWGNHADAGYLTAEADTLDSVTGRGATTLNEITVGNFNVTGTSETVANVTGYSADIDYEGEGYTAYGYTLDYTVFAFKTHNGVKAYSAVGVTDSVTDDSSYYPYAVNLSWDAVDGADGYLVIKEDPYIYTQEVLTNSLTDDNSNWEYQAYATVEEFVTNKTLYTNDMALVGNVDLTASSVEITAQKIDLDSEVSISKDIRVAGTFVKTDDDGNVVYTIPDIGLAKQIMFVNDSRNGFNYDYQTIMRTGDLSLRSTLASEGTAGNRNIMLGSNTGTTLNHLSTNNVFIGGYAGNQATQPTACIGIGTYAGAKGGSYSVNIGFYAGKDSTGSNNVFIGRSAGESTTGSANVFLGYGAGKNQAGVSDTFLIHNRDAGSSAADLTNSILYGTFASAPASQQLTVNAGTLNFNAGVDTDLTINLKGTTNSGVIKWMEDEDYLDFQDIIKLPYTAGAPSTLVNGMVWMESDGLHIYYNGAEKVVAGA